MAYRFDYYDNSLVIDGWENGIAQDPYEGIANLQNVNITTVPGEASVGFATSSKIQTPSYSNITVTASGDAVNVTTPSANVPALEQYQAVYFTSSSITGLSSGTAVYWVYGNVHSGGTATLSFVNVYGGSSPLVIGTTGTAVMYTFNPNTQTRGGLVKNYMVRSLSNRWFLDSNGLVWSDLVLTNGGTGVTATSSWTYTGNLGNGVALGSYTPDSTANGNGMVYMPTVYNGTQNLDGWLFIWRNSAIDYLKIESQGAVISATSLSWVYGWKPSDGTTANSNYLQNPSAKVNSHEAVITPDGRAVYCDAYKLGRFYQTTGTTTFNPTSTATYTYNTYPLLPIDDTAQCLSYLGSRLLVGGKKNKIYPWDLVNTQYSNPLILLAENNVTSIVTVNMNAYVFCGNRGIIYITNGSQAQPLAKVPDFLSGTVQPTFSWGGIAYNQNKLYFGVNATTNGTSTTLSGYGGVWAIDLGSKAMYISNILSGGTGVFPTSILPMEVPGDTFNGYGYYASFLNPTQGTGGVDITVNTPYTDNSAVIETDLIPIGTYTKTRNFNQIEYKLTKPLVAGETITVYYRTDFSQSYTQIFQDLYASGRFSNTNPVNFSNAQWIQFKVALTAAGSGSSFVRLKELRLLTTAVNMFGGNL